MSAYKFHFHTASKKILGDLITPVSAYLKVRDAYPQSALMESSDYHGGENAKSFIALHPIASVSIEHGIGFCRFPDGKEEHFKIDKNYDTARLIGDFLACFDIEGNDMPYLALTNTSLAFQTELPGAETTGWFGQLFLSYGFLAYLAVILSLIASYVLKRTRLGLHLRAVGENPATADAAGISVNRYKYGATCIGSMIAGLGGLYYVMDYAGGIWSNNAFGDRGWLAIALVIFTIWRPNLGIISSFLFGGLYILHMYIPTGTNLAVKELYKMAPYVVTIIVLVISSIRNRRENQPPASLGLSYFREER